MIRPLRTGTDGALCLLCESKVPSDTRVGGFFAECECVGIVCQECYRAYYRYEMVEPTPRSVLEFLRLDRSLDERHGDQA